MHTQAPTSSVNVYWWVWRYWQVGLSVSRRTACGFLEMKSSVFLLFSLPPLIFIWLHGAFLFQLNKSFRRWHPTPSSLSFKKKKKSPEKLWLLLSHLCILAIFLLYSFSHLWLLQMCKESDPSLPLYFVQYSRKTSASGKLQICGSFYRFCCVSFICLNSNDSRDDDFVQGRAVWTAGVHTLRTPASLFPSLHQQMLTGHVEEEWI